MKKAMLVLSLITICFILISCDNKASLSLVSTSVDIVNDKGKTGSIIITEGDKKGQELIPTALYYEFTIKNVGNKKVGGINNKSLQVKIEPKDNLKSASIDVVGFNIYI